METWIYNPLFWIAFIVGIVLAWIIYVIREEKRFEIGDSGWLDYDLSASTIPADQWSKWANKLVILMDCQYTKKDGMMWLVYCPMLNEKAIVAEHCVSIVKAMDH